jgi:hypothetical protein
VLAGRDRLRHQWSRRQAAGLAARSAIAGLHDIAAGTFDAVTAENMRTRLALIILELAKGGERDEGAITAAAVKIMRYNEDPTTFIGW